MPALPVASPQPAAAAEVALQIEHTSATSPPAVDAKLYIFVQSAFLVHQLPEKWSLPSWTGRVELHGLPGIVVALQAANFYVMLVLRCLMRKPRFDYWWSSAFLLLLGCGVLVLLALGFYAATDHVFGVEHSIGLLSMTFLAGVASAGSCLVFYPLAAHFNRPYTTALAIGEGLSGSIPGLLGIFQNSGALPQSFALAFGFGAAMCVMAMVALLLLGGSEDPNMPWPHGLSLIVAKNQH
eukprot:Skav224461  [mRNA]  locus=scaffold1302:118587:127919:+ [translate_table: standard]